MMPQTKPVELDPDMTDWERMNQEREKARPCILPKTVHMEVMDMLRKEKTLSA
ncbi:protein TOC75- chloroplastic-like, partial [Trifolium medium]|nr:protein TOC75- chloroplastic-like [Trifolium medium]